MLSPITLKFLEAVKINNNTERMHKNRDLYLQERKRFTEFAYPVAVTAAYLTLGFLGDYLGFVGWGFYWFLFITIPAYYMVFAPIDHYYHRDEVVIESKDHVIRDHDDDDDDDEDDD